LATSICFIDVNVSIADSILVTGNANVSIIATDVVNVPVVVSDYVTVSVVGIDHRYIAANTLQNLIQVKIMHL